MDMLTTFAPSALLADDLRDAFLADVLTGLVQPQKSVPSRWLYDHEGSALFEEIAQLPEFYPMRTEAAILDHYGADLAVRIGPGRAMIEFGAGNAAKPPLLLDRIAPAAYVPVDISGDFLGEACDAVAARSPALPIFPIVADVTDAIPLPLALGDEARLGVLSGARIGTFAAVEPVETLRAVRETLGAGAKLLIGLDLVKDAAVLEAAYDDAMGVTAQFDLNLAERINRELGGTIPIDALVHRAIWNPAAAQVEMYLEATRGIEFLVAGVGFSLRKGETILTAASPKYDAASAVALLRSGGWASQAGYTDPDEQFLVIVADAA